MEYIGQIIKKITWLLRKSIIPRTIPVKKEEGQALAERYQMPYYQLSPSEKEKFGVIVLDIAKQVISEKSM